MAFAHRDGNTSGAIKSYTVLQALVRGTSVEVLTEGRGISVPWVGTCFPTETIQVHIVLSGKSWPPS